MGFWSVKFFFCINDFVCRFLRFNILCLVVYFSVSLLVVGFFSCCSMFVSMIFFVLLVSFWKLVWGWELDVVFREGSVCVGLERGFGVRVVGGFDFCGVVFFL